MGRKASGKDRIDIINKVQKNGTTYVYRRISIYNKEKGYYITKEEKLLGKKINGSDEILPTRVKSEKGSKKSVNNIDVQAVKTRIGTTAIINHIGAASGIDDDVYASCDKATAQKIIALARYYLQSDGEATSHIDK